MTTETLKGITETCRKLAVFPDTKTLFFATKANIERLESRIKKLNKYLAMRETLPKEITEDPIVSQLLSKDEDAHLYSISDALHHAFMQWLQLLGRDFPSFMLKDKRELHAENFFSEASEHALSGFTEDEKERLKKISWDVFLETQSE